MRGFMLGVALLVWAASAQAATYTAASCSRADVGTAHTSAVAGDIVEIPDGNCTWTSALTVTAGVSVRGVTALGATIKHGAGTSNMLVLTTHATYTVEVSKLRFENSTATGGYFVSVGGTGKPALVHDNYFLKSTFAVGCLRWSATGGVVYSNTFSTAIADGSEGGCFKVTGPSGAWSTAGKIGTADTDGTGNLYIEDNTFEKIIAQVIDVDDDGRVVIRYNTFDNSAITLHGQDTSTQGSRHVEVYNNTFTFTSSGATYNFPLNLNHFIFVRGGTLVWTANAMTDITSGTWGAKPEIKLTLQYLRRAAGPNSCYGAGDGGASDYPGPHQPGYGHNGTAEFSDPIYIWSNTGTGSATPSVSEYGPNECTDPDTVTDYIQSARDYFVGTARPSYTAYTYPHDLRSEQPATRRFFIWAPGSGGDPATSYVVACAGAPRSVVVTAPATSVPVSDVLRDPGDYLCAVEAVNRWGRSRPTAPIPVTVAGQAPATPTAFRVEMR